MRCCKASRQRLHGPQPPEPGSVLARTERAAEGRIGRRGTHRPQRDASAAEGRIGRRGTHRPQRDTSAAEGRIGRRGTHRPQRDASAAEGRIGRRGTHRPQRYTSAASIGSHPSRAPCWHTCPSVPTHSSARTCVHMQRADVCRRTCGDVFARVCVRVHVRVCVCVRACLCVAGYMGRIHGVR
jgi:hypothetical protein